MLQNRIIPVLTIENNLLVKTYKFSKSKYIGDPLNAVRIFNEKERIFIENERILVENEKIFVENK